METSSNAIPNCKCMLFVLLKIWWSLSLSPTYPRVVGDRCCAHRIVFARLSLQASIGLNLKVIKSIKCNTLVARQYPRIQAVTFIFFCHCIVLFRNSDVTYHFFSISTKCCSRFSSIGMFLRWISLETYTTGTVYSFCSVCEGVQLFVRNSLARQKKVRFKCVARFFFESSKNWEPHPKCGWHSCIRYCVVSIQFSRIFRTRIGIVLMCAF